MGAQVLTGAAWSSCPSLGATLFQTGFSLRQGSSLLEGQAHVLAPILATLWEELLVPKVLGSDLIDQEPNPER